jgi:CHASE2 domain-containing sensor protein
VNCGENISVVEKTAESCSASYSYTHEVPHRRHFFWNGLWNIVAGIFLVCIGLGVIFSIDFWAWFIPALLISTGFGIIAWSVWHSRRKSWR